MNNRFLWLFAGFVLLVALLAVGLTLNPREVPSPLIDKSAPDFSLPRLDDGKDFSPREMLGQVWLLNVWASWCASCRDEHPALVALARQKRFPIVGLNYKEVRGDAGLDADKLSPDEEIALAVKRAQGWLAAHGDPYLLSVLDLSGQTGIDYGVYGVPESYLIDRQGVIRYKHIGPLNADNADVLNGKILPLAEKLAEEGAHDTRTR
ncbi:MAG: DsbE family thiol:disulfide interchange protein [Zoogloeaceae bacterium]|jgi:cytochrome c biogenesis protein CcmG/thiol:disulfide interchange protein DsbE|nr:DsbE family thiol:disulfide interchange protein [Zoogloeaceae bacterium]